MPQCSFAFFGRKRRKEVCFLRRFQIVIFSSFNIYTQFVSLCCFYSQELSPFPHMQQFCNQTIHILDQKITLKQQRANIYTDRNKILSTHDECSRSDFTYNKTTWWCSRIVYLHWKNSFIKKVVKFWMDWCLFIRRPKWMSTQKL